MVRQAYLFVILALIAGCGQKTDSAPSAGGTVYDPWTQKWDARASQATEVALSYVAWPTGERETAELEVEKSFPANPRPGRDFEGRLVVRNLTGQALKDLIVTERLGYGTYLTASVPQGRSTSGGIYRWELGTVGPGQSRTIRITGRVDEEGPITSSTSARYTVQEDYEQDG